MSSKKRLDILLIERYPAYSRQQIQSWIMQGRVLVKGQAITKPGTPVLDTTSIELCIEEPRYVCRAGWKLEKALDFFKIDVTGLIILDAGLSTGGFTDCLLQRGAIKVYGIDVGYGQVHEKLRKDPRLIIHERTNLRHLETVGELVDLITLDLSFISILKVMDAVNKLLKPAGKLVTLIKPQFEAGKHDVGKGGIITDPAIHERVINQVTSGIEAAGFTLLGVTESPITGSSGNKEFLAYFIKK